MTYIVTLQLDSASQAHFNGMRERYFPPAINYIGAHVTLFHTLPEVAEVVEELSGAASACAAFPVAVTGVRSLGKGVAYTLESAEAQAVHRRLAGAFADHLSAQDKQKFQPHIVVQNKVRPEEAKALLQQLRASFIPMRVEATGLSLWHYRNGPWELARSLAFQAP